ncbi:hypothetical protein BGZ58_010610 [Dissophora ornata]|nr:hypothetical protein BGZ58_010610 [Dissophora ornata]
MQDENAIEAQHSPRFKSTSHLKNKSESIADGMPPQKTQKLGHVTSTQLLETTPLNAVTNLPRVHSWTHSPPGTLKGKQAQGISLLSKSQITANATFQTRLDFQNKAKQRHESPERENAAVERGQATLKALEYSLEEPRRAVEQLQWQCEQAEGTLNSMRGVFKKMEIKLAEQVRDAELEQKELEATVADQESEIQRYQEQVLELTFQTENKLLEIQVREREMEQFEEATLKELGSGNLQEMDAELIELKDIVSEEMEKVLSELKESIESAEATEDLKQRLQEHDIYIKYLESDLSFKNDDMDAELTSFLLGNSIGEELVMHRTRYDLTKGSDLDKEVTKYQKQLVIKHERQLSSLTQKHAVQMEQIAMKTQSHERRLAKLQKNIEDAVATIVRSEDDFEEAKKERVQVQTQADCLRKAIDDLSLQLTHL